MNTPYDDIIFLEHPSSKKHPRMACADRAAQFAPFAAGRKTRRIADLLHRHGRFHPQLESDGPTGLLGIDFVFYHSITKLRG